MKYEVDFEYNVPEWAVVEIDADTVEEAENKAQAEFEMMFPEAVEPVVLGVNAVNE